MLVGETRRSEVSDAGTKSKTLEERAGSLHVLHKEEVVLVYIKFRRSSVYI